MMSKVSIPSAIAAMFRDVLPKELDEFHRGEADVAQTSMWLVGLASTMLLFCAANPSKVDQIFFGLTRFGVAFLMVTVVAGVLNRLLRVWVGRRISRSLRHLHGHFAGFMAAEHIEEPDELSDRWTREEIVLRLRETFDVDYGWLEKYNVALPDCQQCYRDQYSIWERFNGQRLEGIKKILAAYMGLSNCQVEKMFGPTTDADLAKSKCAARFSSLLWMLSMGLFLIAACAFLLAVTLFSRGLWIQTTIHAF